jgi:hypothetical protein
MVLKASKIGLLKEDFCAVAAKKPSALATHAITVHEINAVQY